MEHSYLQTKVLLALAAGLVAFGFAPILVRVAVDTPPLVLATYRTCFAFIMLLPFWVVKRDKTAARTAVKDRKLMALSGICLGLHFICWISSLYYTSVASASVLVAIHPVILILVERLWFKRGFAFTTWLGVCLAFLGSVALGISDSYSEQTFSNPTLGNILAISAALIFVVYLLIGQKIRQKREWIDYVLPVYFFAAVTCLVLTLVFGAGLFNFSAKGIVVGIGLALGPQILGHGSMNYAVKYVSPTLLSTLVLSEPLLASVLAYFLFGELPYFFSIAAMLIILSGVGLSWKRTKPQLAE